MSYSTLVRQDTRAGLESVFWGLARTAFFQSTHHCAVCGCGSETEQKPVGYSSDFEVFAAVRAAERRRVVLVAEPVAGKVSR